MTSIDENRNFILIFVRASVSLQYAVCFVLFYVYIQVMLLLSKSPSFRVVKSQCQGSFLRLRPHQLTPGNGAATGWENVRFWSVRRVSTGDIGQLPVPEAKRQRQGSAQGFWFDAWCSASSGVGNEFCFKFSQMMSLPSKWLQVSVMWERSVDRLTAATPDIEGENGKKLLFAEGLSGNKLMTTLWNLHQ